MKAQEFKRWLEYACRTGIPALTMTGDIEIGANKVKTSNLSLLELDANRFQFRNSANSAYKGIVVASIDFSGDLGAFSDGVSLNAIGDDNGYLLFKAKDNGVGLVEIARVIGGVDPLFQTGRDDTGVSTNTVTDVLNVIAGAGTNNEAAGQGAGIAFKIGNAASEVEKRAAIEAVLNSAANGTEAAGLFFYAMANGSLQNIVQLYTWAFDILISGDIASSADLVRLGGFDIAAGRRTLNLAVEESVNADIGLASTHSLIVRINQASYKIPLIAV